MAGKGILDFLPEIRWADFPVSLFVLRAERVSGSAREPLAPFAAAPRDIQPLLARLDAGLPARAGSSLHSAARGAPSGQVKERRVEKSSLLAPFRQQR